MLGTLACLASVLTVLVGAGALLLRSRLGRRGRRRAAAALLAVAGTTGALMIAGMVASAWRLLVGEEGSGRRLAELLLGPAGWFVLGILVVAPALEIARALEGDRLPPPGRR